MIACFRGNREEFYGEVLLLDERKLTLTGVKKSSKAAAILQQVFSHLNLVEVKFFGLRFCDDKQQTHWLDPSKTLSQHRLLIGPPYIFYFGVKFYVEDPTTLEEETTRGVSRLQAQSLVLSLCSSLQMYGVSLFAAYGENQTEYFLGPTPVGVVIYKNKELVGKYFWPRITKLHFKDEMFELRVFSKNANQSREPMMKQTAPPAAHRSGGGAKPDQGRPSAPWENSGAVSGLFNPKFPPNTKEEEQDGGRPQRCSRSLDGDRPIRAQRRRSSSHGNTSSGSESEKSNSERRRRRTKRRGRHGDRGHDSASRCRARSHSPDACTWKHIQKQLVEPDCVIDRQTEEIPYKEVRVTGEPIRTRRSPRGRRHQLWASASQLQSKMVPPLPVTMTTDTSCRAPTGH